MQRISLPKGTIMISCHLLNGCDQLSQCLHWNVIFILKLSCFEVL